MARSYGSRASRRNRNRIYTVVSLVIIVIIIAYIYLPGESRIDLIPNSSNQTVTSDTDTTSSTHENSSTNDTTLQSSTPNWSTPSGSGATANNEASSTNQEQVRTNDVRNVPLTVPSGFEGISTTTQNPLPTGDSEADKLIAQANALLKQGMSKTVAARDKFNEALRSRTISKQQAQFVKKQLSSLADDWLFYKGISQGDTLCEYYKVKSGDRLQIIGEKNKVPFEILMTLNNISDPKKIQVGQNLKIVKGPFRAVVYRSTYTMDIYLQNTYVRTFKVGLGLPGSETPTGMWKVKTGGKLIEPIWTDPEGKTHYPSDADYPLGSRWIALDGVSGNAVGRTGFAIHGTHEPESLGKASSQGCIRMENGSAILVYNMLFPGYSTVEVLD